MYIVLVFRSIPIFYKEILTHFQKNLNFLQKNMSNIVGIYSQFLISQFKTVLSTVSKCHKPITAVLVS